jgi:hypothetical protein
MARYGYVISGLKEPFFCESILPSRLPCYLFEPVDHCVVAGFRMLTFITNLTIATQTVLATQASVRVLITSVAPLALSAWPFSTTLLLAGSVRGQCAHGRHHVAVPAQHQQRHCTCAAFIAPL